MTHIEFETRTMVAVSSKEFDAINEVYMNSDLDKDEFCKMWCKMNRSRVDNAKIEAIAKAREEANRDFAWHLVTYGYTSDEFNGLADNYFNAYEKNFLKTRLGIEMQGTNSWGIPYFRSVNEILWDLNKYLNKSLNA